jgi:hypothetical protein
VTWIAIDNIGLDHHLSAAQWDSQGQRFADRNLGLGIHVEAAQTYVFAAGDARGVAAVKTDVHEQSGTIMVTPLLLKMIFSQVLFTHSLFPQ